MNKIFSYTFFAAVALMSLASCEKNNLVIGKDVTPPALAKFATMTNGDTTGTYIIRSSNQPYKIPVGFTNVSNVDRTITLNYSSPTAVKGQQFNAPETIVVKAGEAIDSLEITGIFAGYNNNITRSDRLVISITGGDAPVSLLKSNYILTMKMYWEADLNAFAGDYIIQDYYNGAPDGGPYEVTLTPVSLNGPVSIVSMEGLWGSPVPVRITLDWADRETGKTTIPQANWYMHSSYGQITINPNATGTFSVPENKMTIGYEGTVSAGSFGKYVSTLVKK